MPRWTERLSVLTQSHAELVLVVTILVVSVVFHWIPQKIAFLNFFYLPVLAAGYLLGGRRAISTTVLCVLLVLNYYGWAWTREALTQGSSLEAVPAWIISHQWETLFSLATWGGFVILTGIAFTRVHEKMVASYNRVRDLNQVLQQQAHELENLNQSLTTSTTELQQNTAQLEQKNLLIEQLRQQMEQTLYTTMDSTVARLMVQGRLRQEKRRISVLFCDLKGFSTYSEQRQPEVILEDLNDFYGVVEERVETYHGHIDKYMGDGIMCEFGAPVDYEQHCLQATICGLKIQEAFQGRNLPWGLRIGIASGDAVVGLLGVRRQSYSALGEVVNLAHRLEELCEPGQLYIDETTYETIQPFIEVEQVRSLTGRREEDKKYLELLAQKENQLARDPNNPELLFTLGMVYLQIRQASKAVQYIRRAMDLKPDDRDIKVAYADASMKQDEYEKIAIRGLARRQAVFKVLGLKNPLCTPERFPGRLYEAYKYVEGLIEIPNSITLQVEVIDGSVGHSLCVAFLSYVLADAMGLPEDLKRNLLVAGRLQDLGKSEIWHHTLNRRGGLSDAERKEIEGHVAASVSLAKRMGYDRPGVIEIIAGHHEALNGTGFPKHLSGDHIPLGARISSVADAYCALTAWRPYRPAWDAHVSRSEVRKGVEAGRYDPTVVNALEQLFA